jgi:hypothetical protein
MSERPVSEIDKFRAGGLSPKELEGRAAELRANARPAVEQEGERMTQFLRRDFETARDEAEPAAFEDLSAYVDGTLSDADREAFETRLGDDRLLQAEVQDLKLLRAALEAERATPLRMHPRFRQVVIWGGLAAAAAALIAFLLHRMPYNDFPTPPENLQARGGSAPPPAPPRVHLHDSAGEIILRADGTIVATASLTPELQRVVKDALESGRVPRPAGLDTLQGSAGVLMGAGGGSTSFAPRSPVGTYVREDRPLFRWSAYRGARAYVVGVYDEQLDKVAESPELRATEWRPKAALRRGSVYLWQVTALTSEGRVVAPAPPEPQSRVRLLSAEEVRAVDERLQGAGASHLAAALMLAEAGLIDDAQQALNALRDENPDSIEVKRLLDQLRRPHDSASSH